MRFIFEHRASIVLFNVLREFSEKDVFILPANICPIVPLTFLKAKVSFDFVDIYSENQCLNTNLVLDKIKNNKKKYKGILFNRAYGLLEDKSSFFNEIKDLDSKTFIIDDRCLTIPQPFQTDFDVNVDLILYSTGYSKYVDFNYGGFAFLRKKYNRKSLLYKPEDHEHQIQTIKKHLGNGSMFEYEDNDWLGNTNYAEVEIEYRNKIQQQIGIVSAHKKNINSIYENALPFEIKKGIPSVWRFNLSVNKKEELLKDIFKSGLFASSHYASVSELFGFEKCPVASYEHRNMINLFNDLRVDEEFAFRICGIINNYIH